MKKSLPAAADDDDDDDSCFSPFSCLPDDVVLEIFKKLTDLKTLCFCEVVSKRFYAIVHQVDTICYTSQDLCSLDLTKRELLLPVCISMGKFSRVKSLCIQFLSNRFHKEGVNNDNDDDDDGYLFKWMVKWSNNGSFSFVFVSPTSIYDKNNNGLLLHEEKQNVYIPLKVSIAFDCFDQFSRLRMLIYGIICLPLLEKVSCMDLGNRGRVSVNGRAKIDDLRDRTLSTNVKDVDRDNIVKVGWCYVPLLELPVSGYVMKGVSLLIMDWNDAPEDVTYDSFINDEIDFKQDKEEAAYHEAVTEIFKKHRSSIVRLG